MLANKYTDCKDKIKFPCAYQPKLDGIRCLNKKEGLKSRNGKDIISVPHVHIPDVLKSYDLVTSFDGELYNHEYKEDFNEILSMINKSKMTDQQVCNHEWLLNGMWDGVSPDGRRVGGQVYKCRICQTSVNNDLSGVNIKDLGGKIVLKEETR
jgi:hypothetical protein